MSDYYFWIFAAVAVLFVLSRARDEWRSFRHRRDRDYFIHLVGKRPWWGGR